MQKSFYQKYLKVSDIQSFDGFAFIVLMQNFPICISLNISNTIFSN